MIKTNREKSILVFLFLFYSVLQFFVLGKRGLDGDEGVILKVALATDWQSFWAFIANDVHPPLYHLLARVSMNIFGAHEWSLRLPAALAGALLIPLGYFLGKNIFNKKSLELLLVALFTLSPYLFYFHSEARFYSLLLLGATLTYIAILRMQSGKNVWWWLLFFLGALTMVWTQYLGWFLLGIEICALIVTRQWRVARRVATACFLLLLSYIPFYTIAATQISGRLMEQGGLTLGENVKGIFGALYRFGAGRLILGVEPARLLSGGLSNILLFAVSLFVPMLIIVAGWQLQKKHTSLARQNFSIIVAIVLSSIIMALLVSEVGGRATRYLIYLWPFYGIFIVLGIMSIWPRTWGKITTALFFIVMLAGLGKHIYACNEAVSVREIATLLMHEAGSQDAILTKGAFAGGESTALKFYFKKDITIFDYFSNYKPGLLKEQTPETELFINQALKSHEVVWYYDFTYGNFKEEEVNGVVSENFVGRDKEEKEMVIYKIVKR